MVEFGSDFHRCDENYHSIHNYLRQISSDLRFYANGRLIFDELIKQEGWKRIWIPAYFCYEVIGHIKSSGIDVILYDDHPLNIDFSKTVRSLPYEDGDVLLRMNYFGLRNFDNNIGIPVPVIEDHTHSLTSEYALNSTADWCVCSIRKTIPIAAGGLLWSPTKKRLPNQLPSSAECETMSTIRYAAMGIKADFLKYGGDKSTFRSKYLLSEEMIDSIGLCGMDSQSYRILQSFDVEKWTENKDRNWNVAFELLKHNFHILPPTDFSQHPFSLIILCESSEDRNQFKSYLVSHSIYPAILWNVPEDSLFKNALEFSQRMLSIHCDPRYDIEDIKYMCRIINSYYD